MHEIGALTRLGKSLVNPAADVWARAFQDDPLWRYFLPDEPERPNKLARAFQKTIQDGVWNGEVYATSPQLEAVAVWRFLEKEGMTTSQAVISAWQWVRSGGFLDLFRMSRLEISRQARVGEYMDLVHKRYAPFPHWKLVGIGVDPELQGKGYASMLLKSMFARMDTEHSSCYLETHNHKNVPLYQHYGFEVVEEGVIPGTEITQWTMLRKQDG